MKVLKSQAERISKMHKALLDIGELGLAEMLYIKDHYEEWSEEEARKYFACQDSIAEGLKQSLQGIVALEDFLTDQMEKDGVFDDSEGDVNASTTVN